MVILKKIKDEKILLQYIEQEKKDRNYFKESQVQEMVVQYLDTIGVDCHPSLSGIQASRGLARFMKKQGIKRGHSDLIIYKRVGNHELLFLELKTVVGKLSKEQKEWLNTKREEGYAVSVSYGYYDAIYKINRYLDNNPIIYENEV